MFRVRRLRGGGPLAARSERCACAVPLRAGRYNIRMKLSFTKMHGAGNDFVVIDATRAPFRPSPALLQRLTDRRFGVGCDQVLVVEPASTADVDFDYRIFNADGSEVGQCGNGSRALARFVREHGLSSREAIRVRTQTSVLELRHVGGERYSVNMGAPRLAPADIPFTAAARADRYTLTLDGGEAVEIGAVSMGNPHAVLLVADVDQAPVAELGQRLQAHPAFPQSVNVGFLQVLDRGAQRVSVGYSTRNWPLRNSMALGTGGRGVVDSMRRSDRTIRACLAAGSCRC